MFISFIVYSHLSFEILSPLFLKLFKTFNLSKVTVFFFFNPK